VTDSLSSAITCFLLRRRLSVHSRACLEVTRCSVLSLACLEALNPSVTCTIMKTKESFASDGGTASTSVYSRMTSLGPPPGSLSKSSELSAIVSSTASSSFPLVPPPTEQKKSSSPPPSRSRASATEQQVEHVQHGRLVGARRKCLRSSRHERCYVQYRKQGLIACVSKHG
jgi:hypothetical protein